MTPATPGDAVIRIGVAALFVLHGLILVLGLAKGLRFVNLAHLTTPGSPAIGLLWLAAGLLCCAAVAALFLAPRWWWAVVTNQMAVVIAQVVIFTSWSDAKGGTIANALLLVAVLYGWA